ncbi:MAG: 4-alpha-glucanotransferase [Bacilli bacterium]|nr:4-alpha-glucanotransferase [Bacilli bacterium]
MQFERNAGVLLHVTSLPSKYGVGTLGQEAYNFVDWLKKAKMSIWQVLPLVPTNYGDSPYQSVSSTAVNYYLIDFDVLNEKGLLKKKEYQNEIFTYNKDRVDYGILFYKKTEILKLAFSRYKPCTRFKKYVKDKESHDFAVFMTIKAMHEYKAWNYWDEEYRIYSKELEEKIVNEHKDEYLFWIWTQFEFLNQWNKLHRYALKRGIEIMGDMPLYVAYDSVEVWKHPELFDLNDDRSLKSVAGCPPDAFSDDGQLWGNPIYDWKYMKETNYAWWTQRISSAFKLYDILRIDHFRGFDRFYSIPADHVNARHGEWVDGPKFDLFKDKLDLKIVAEDLGVIDDGVITLMRQTQYPGMKIMEFAFDGYDQNEHKPTNVPTNSIIYTGTHDNMPITQYILDLEPWRLDVFKKDARHQCAHFNVKYNDSSVNKLVDTLVELAFASPANTCIIPMQDLLCQGGYTRMNLPSTVSTDNWSYRVSKRKLTDALAARLAAYVEKYNR